MQIFDFLSETTWRNYKKVLNFYISIGHLNKQVMHMSSNDIPFQNQLVIGGVAHKLYIHTQAFEFYQCGTIPLFIFQHAPSRVGY